MANRTSPVREASRAAAWLLKDLGRELRVARILSGATQAQVAHRLGRSRSHVSRVENGLVAGVRIGDLTRHAAIVGLRLFARLYPLGRRAMDGSQLALFERFRVRIANAWVVDLEVPMPIPGDLRAADAVLSRPGCRCMVEVITRLADFQAQVRAARLKQRDLGAERLMLVILASTTNRRVLREAAFLVADGFPVNTKSALRSLSVGEDPGGDAAILL